MGSAAGVGHCRCRPARGEASRGGGGRPGRGPRRAGGQGGGRGEPPRAAGARRASGRPLGCAAFRCAPRTWACLRHCGGACRGMESAPEAFPLPGPSRRLRQGGRGLEQPEPPAGTARCRSGSWEEARGSVKPVGRPAGRCWAAGGERRGWFPGRLCLGLQAEPGWGAALRNAAALKRFLLRLTQSWCLPCDRKGSRKKLPKTMSRSPGENLIPFAKATDSAEVACCCNLPFNLS